MPLVQFSSKRGWHPHTDVPFEELEPQPRQIVNFGRALPKLMVDNREALCLEEDTTPVTVQVSHVLTNSHDVHAPDLWIKIELTEASLTEEQHLEATAKLKELIYEWFWLYFRKEVDVPAEFIKILDIACYVFWPNGSHGFLRIGDTELDW